MPWGGCSCLTVCLIPDQQGNSRIRRSDEVLRQAVMSARRYLSSLWRDVAAQLALRAPQRPVPCSPHPLGGY